MNATLKAGTKYRVETEGEKLGEFQTLSADTTVAVISLGEEFNIYNLDGEWIYVHSSDEVA